MAAPNKEKADASSLFKRHFGYRPAQSVSVPKTVELLGRFAESQEGLVLSAAVNRYVHFASAPRTDGKIELVSAGATGPDLFWISNLKSNPSAPWAEPVKAVLAQLRKRSVHFSGFNAAIASDSLAGQQRADDAALMVATALAVRRLHPFSLTETGSTIPPKANIKGQLPPLDTTEKLIYAKLCQAAVGQNIGAGEILMNALSSLCGKAWHVLSIDLRFLTVAYSPIIGEVLVLCEPGARTTPETRNIANDHSSRTTPAEKLEADKSNSDTRFVTGSEEEILHHCDSAARKLGAKSLRSVELKFLEANKDKLTPREYECARHVVSEVRRAVAAEQALSADDHRQFGEYLFRSHESTRKLLNRPDPELEKLLELARGHPGCLGAKALNSGTLNLVAYHQAEAFMNDLGDKYKERTGNKPVMIVSQLVEGAG